MEQNPGIGQKIAGMCLVCNHPKKAKEDKFCSLECYWKNKKGKKHSWGYKISAKLKGVPKSPEHIENARLAKIGVHKKDRGEKSVHWKGEDALYGTKHDWVYSRKGSPQKCEHCGTTEKRMYHWANISGKYLRDLSDWKRLCVPCHSKFDKEKRN